LKADISPAPRLQSHFRNLHCRPHDHIAAAGARNRALDEQQLALGIHALLLHDAREDEGDWNSLTRGLDDGLIYLGSQVRAAGMSKAIASVGVNISSAEVKSTGADGRALSEAEIESGAMALVEQMRARGAHVHVPRGDLGYAVRVGLRMLELRRIIEARDGKYMSNPNEAVLLRYYANSIAQHVAAAPTCAAQ